MPSSAYASEPRGSFSRGQAEQQDARGCPCRRRPCTPSPARRWRAGTGPGIERDRLADAAAVDDEERDRRGRRRPARSRGPACAAAASRADVGDGTSHAPSLAPPGIGGRGPCGYGRSSRRAPARAPGSCTRSGITSVARPYSAAVAAVIGPMDATVIRPRQRAPLRVAEQLGEVPRGGRARERHGVHRARRERLAEAADAVLDAPGRGRPAPRSRRRPAAGARRPARRASPPRAGAARGRPAPTTAASRSTRPSARYSPGTSSARTPCSASASAVAGPIAATRLRGDRRPRPARAPTAGGRPWPRRSRS